MSNPTVSVTADLRSPISGTAGNGSVAFELMSPLADPPTLWGDNTTFTAPVTAGAFGAPVVLEANAFWQITVQCDVMRKAFEVYVPASPSSTTLAALWELALATPTIPDQFIPYSSRGVPGGVATLDDTGLVTSSQLPADIGAAPLWQQALDHAGLLDESLIEDYASDPDQPITLAAGFYENLRFTCTQLLVPSSLTKLKNCDVITSNNDYGVRVDAFTGFEVGRRFEHCRFTGQGVGFAGAGYAARLCEVYNNGDDFARVGRSYAEPTVLELCYAHDFKPKASAHADGIQVVTPPAADVIVTGCVISMNTAAGYTLPGDAGYTGAIFVDTDDVAEPVDDPQPTRRGMIRVSHSKLFSSNNYTVVISGPNTDISDCTILPGTTATESITGGNFVTGRNNVDGSGVPIVDTDIVGSPTRALLVGDSRITLDSLGNVDTAGVQDGQVITWSSASGAWLPKTPSASGGGSSTFADLTDVQLTSLQSGQVPTWSGTKWVNETPSGGGGGTSPSYYSTGFISDTFGPCNSGMGLTPQTQAPAAFLVKIPGTDVAVGNVVHWRFGIISHGNDAQFDVASIVAGDPVNYYSGGFTPSQFEVGAGDLYQSGDFGVGQPLEVDWVVQAGDLDPADDNSFTLSLLYVPGGSRNFGLSSQVGQVTMVNFH
jgi:hypothetical protein